METAKLFWSGRSQAVRLPKDFRFEGQQARIRRHGNALILEPMVDGWDWRAEIIGPVDEDFAKAALARSAIHNGPLQVQGRTGLQVLGKVHMSV